MTQHPLPFAPLSPGCPEKSCFRAETSRPVLLVPDRAAIESPDASSSTLPEALSLEGTQRQDSSASAASVPREEVSEAALDRLVDRLRGVQGSAGIELAYRLGERVVLDLYGGDVEQIHRTGPRGRAFGRLARHPALPCSRSTLSRAIRIYQLLCRLPAFRTREELSVQHFHAVLGRSLRAQKHWLEKAADERWSAARLTAEVAAGREERVRRRGRPPMPPEMRRLRQVLRAVASSALCADRTWFERLSEEEQTDVKDALTKVSAWCIGLQAASLPRSAGDAEPPRPDAPGTTLY